mmetsp:Transcript_46236/g.104835  ORF Transcript_46236/g.104835 Transcript_46236/m.104835 type:complete len:223 (-) Transcript_46236:538-1206(-)
MAGVPLVLLDRKLGVEDFGARVALPEVWCGVRYERMRRIMNLSSLQMALLAQIKIWALCARVKNIASDRIGTTGITYRIPPDGTCLFGLGLCTWIRLWLRCFCHSPPLIATGSRRRLGITIVALHAGGLVCFPAFCALPRVLNFRRDPEIGTGVREIATSPFRTLPLAKKLAGRPGVGNWRCRLPFGMAEFASVTRPTRTLCKKLALLALLLGIWQCGRFGR